MKRISYIITTHNETDSLKALLTLLERATVNTQDEILIWDDYSTDEDTKTIINQYVGKTNVILYQSELEKDYAAHKNASINHATGDYVFAIDADELPPSSLLGENLHALIDENPDTDLFYVPRLNKIDGVTKEHAQQWGWTLTPSELLGCSVIQWPDYQSRIFKRDRSWQLGGWQNELKLPCWRIRWQGRLHETIVGHQLYAYLPQDESFALVHTKTIEQQIKTNERYNKDFSVQDNMGHRIG